MSLHDQLKGANPSPNLDIVLPAGEDASAALHLAARVDAMFGKLISSSGSPLYCGVQQNAPVEGGALVSRIAGLTVVIFGETVAVGDRLIFDETTGKAMLFDFAAMGHTHGATAQVVERVFFLTDEVGERITGADPADFTFTLERSEPGLTSAPETITLSELSAGRYLVSFTPDLAGALYILSIAHEVGGAKSIVTPQEFQLTTTATLGAPTSMGGQIAGRAWTSGDVDEQGLMLIERQVF